MIVINVLYKAKTFLCMTFPEFIPVSAWWNMPFSSTEVRNIKTFDVVHFWLIIVPKVIFLSFYFHIISNLSSFKAWSHIYKFWFAYIFFILKCTFICACLCLWWIPAWLYRNVKMSYLFFKCYTLWCVNVTQLLRINL